MYEFENLSVLLEFKPNVIVDDARFRMGFMNKRSYLECHVWHLAKNPTTGNNY